MIHLIQVSTRKMHIKALWEKIQGLESRIAQWAVNVVDFMDADSICTPFEYDLYPFSATDLSTGTQKDPTNSGRTWCVDSIIDDSSGTLSQDDNKPWRGLVWGCNGQSC